MRVVQLISLFVFAMGAIWHARPLLNRMSRADALTALLWIHVFRHVALFAFSAKRDGFAMSNAGITAIVIGDVLGAAVAFLAICLLRARWSLGVVLSWLVVLESVIDFSNAFQRRRLEPVEPGGVLYMILAFFVPMVVVSLPVLVWQLVTRRHEPLRAT